MAGMTAVFVDGVPETPAVWNGLLAALDRPGTVALSLPGFGSARPAGYGATMDEYAAWLAAELERLGDPVYLVGQDWGGGFVVRVVSTRPDLVRSWVTDAAGIGDVAPGPCPGSCLPARVTSDSAAIRSLALLTGYHAASEPLAGGRGRRVQRCGVLMFSWT